MLDYYVIGALVIANNSPTINMDSISITLLHDHDQPCKLPNGGLQCYLNGENSGIGQFMQYWVIVRADYFAENMNTCAVSICKVRCESL